MRMATIYSKMCLFLKAVSKTLSRTIANIATELIKAKATCILTKRENISVIVDAMIWV